MWCKRKQFLVGTDSSIQCVAIHTGGLEVVWLQNSAYAGKLDTVFHEMDDHQGNNVVGDFMGYYGEISL